MSMKNKRKGITPVISIIILLLIAIALAGAAWTFMGGLAGSFMKGSLMVVDARCEGVKNATIVLRNIGTQSLSLGDCLNTGISGSSKTCGRLIIDRIDGISNMDANLSTLVLNPGQEVTFKDEGCDGTTTPVTCVYNFRIEGAGTGSTKVSVQCG